MTGKQSLTTENTIFFSTANAGYATYAAVSLLGIRKHLPDARLCILSSGLSDYDKKILEKQSIEYNEFDLSAKFTKTWEYPIDCYYLFAGPEIFQEQGFKYSVYVDGDILCKNNPLVGIPDIQHVAGVESSPKDGKYTSIFGKDWDSIKDIWGLSDETASRRRIQSGMVFFNNEAMAQLCLLDKAGRLFRESIKNRIPRKGDDSLLALLQYVYLRDSSIVFLPPQYNYILPFNQWNDPTKKLVFFHFALVDKPWIKEPYIHNDGRQKMINIYVREWRTIFRETAPRAWLINTFKGAEFIYKGVMLTRRYWNKARRLLHDQSLWIVGLKKNLYTRRINSHKKKLKIYWWRYDYPAKLNFGDEVTPDIIQKIWGYRCKWVKANECDLIGAGSILGIVARKNISGHKIKVWGSGVIKNEDRFDSRDFDIYAVRGPLTKSKLALSEGTVQCDPGLLANIVYRRSKNKKYKVGILAHYADAGEEAIEKYRSKKDYLLINPLDSPEKVAFDISSCQLVLSSSLHGLIFADSFGVPNYWTPLSDKVVGGDYKFTDYYLSTGRELRRKSIDDILASDAKIAEAIGEYQPITTLRKMQKRLIKAFPYDKNYG